MADRNKLGAALQAAKAGQNGKRSNSADVSTSVSTDVSMKKHTDKSNKLSNRQLIEGLGLNTAEDKPTTITIRLPSTTLKSLWQVRAKQDGITLTDAIVEALTERWGSVGD